MEVNFNVEVWYSDGESMSETEAALLEFASVSPKLKDKMVVAIQKLERKSTHSSTFIAHATGQLWYIKVRQGSNDARLYFSYGQNNTIWLLNGCLKKTQKRDKQHYSKALSLYKEAQYA